MNGGLAGLKMGMEQIRGIDDENERHISSRLLMLILQITGEKRFYNTVVQ